MHRDSSSLAVTLALALVLIICFSILFPTLFKPAPPVIEVLSCSLNKEKVKANEIFQLAFEVKNNDNQNSHFLRVEFESHVLVSFYLGGQTLPKDEGKWYFTTTLTPSATLKQPINVNAGLEQGVAEISYSIVVNFYADGNQVDSIELKVTVEK